MNSWLIGVVAIVFLISVLAIIIPEGRLGSFIKPFLSLTVVIVVFYPVFTGDSGSFFSKDTAAYRRIDYDEKYLSSMFDKKIENYQKNCVEILEKSGITNAPVKIKYNVKEDYSISIIKAFINLSDAVISSEKEHIDLLSEIKRDICDYLIIEEKDIIINE